MPQWVHNFASVITLISFPITLASLNTTFNFSPVTITFPDMPFGGSVKIVLFLLLSLTFAVAFADWYRRADINRNFDRFVTCLLLGFISAAQSFATIQIIWGDFEGRAGVFGLGMAAALILETRAMLANPHRRVELLVAYNAVVFAIFGFFGGMGNPLLEWSFQRRVTGHVQLQLQLWPSGILWCDGSRYKIQRIQDQR